MGDHSFIQCITYSPALLQLYLFAVDKTSPEELADIALSWIMSLTADAFLAFL